MDGRPETPGEIRCQRRAPGLAENQHGTGIEKVSGKRRRLPAALKKEWGEICIIAGTRAGEIRLVGNQRGMLGAGTEVETKGRLQRGQAFQGGQRKEEIPEGSLMGHDDHWRSVWSPLGGCVESRPPQASF